MSMEFDINFDPGTYEARNVFGMFTPRQALFGAVAVAVSAAVTWAATRVGADPLVVGSVCVGVCVPIGYFGLAKRHGLDSEVWVPLIRLEREAPQELTWAGPKAAAGWAGTGGTGTTRREARERRRELEAVTAVEMEGDSVMAGVLAEVMADEDPGPDDGWGWDQQDGDGVPLDQRDRRR